MNEIRLKEIENGDGYDSELDMWETDKVQELIAALRQAWRERDLTQEWLDKFQGTAASETIEVLKERRRADHAEAMLRDTYIPTLEEFKQLKQEVERLKDQLTGRPIPSLELAYKGRTREFDGIVVGEGRGLVQSGEVVEYIKKLKAICTDAVAKWDSEVRRNRDVVGPLTKAIAEIAALTRRYADEYDPDAGKPSHAILRDIHRIASSVPPGD